MTLPADLNCERLVLGAALIESAHMDILRSGLTPAHFSLDSHRRIWSAMCSIYDRGSTVDRIVVLSELADRKQSESVGGLSYLVSLDEGLPQVPSLDRYVAILQKKARLRFLIALCESTSKRAISELEDPADIEESMHAAIATDSDPNKRAISTRQMIEKVGIDELLKPRRNEGLRLPWERLNESLCGMHGGQMIVIAGDTGRGKTSMALQIATHATRQGKSPIIWTMEMTPRQMFARMVNQLAEIDADLSRHGELSETHLARRKQAAFWLHGHPVWFDRHSRNVASFCASIRQASAKSEVGLAIVDYLQLIRGTQTENRTREVGENSRSLKLAAMDHQIPFLVLSQFRRHGGESATIHSLKESGDIENDSDVILLLNSPETEGKQSVPMSVRIGKQREGPSGFDIPLEFRLPSQSFHSVEES